MLFQILYYDMVNNFDLITVITKESDDKIWVRNMYKKYFRYLNSFNMWLWYSTLT